MRQSLFVCFFFSLVKWRKMSFYSSLLLLLLSCFSRVCLCVTPETAGSPPGSPVPGILQARTLEWVAISFSNAWKWKFKVNLLSRVWLPETPWTAAYQAPPSMGFTRQEYWSGLPLPSLYSSQILKVFCWEVKFNLGWQRSLRVPMFLLKLPPPQLWHSSHQDWRWGHLRIPQAYGETTFDRQPFLFQNQTFKILLHRRP